MYPAWLNHKGPFIAAIQIAHQHPLSNPNCSHSPWTALRIKAVRLKTVRIEVIVAVVRLPR
jgi:hypothetical protein